LPENCFVAKTVKKMRQRMPPEEHLIVARRLERREIESRPGRTPECDPRYLELARAPLLASFARSGDNRLGDNDSDVSETCTCPGPLQANPSRIFFGEPASLFPDFPLCKVKGGR
jgi:hypothetical protein